MVAVYEESRDESAFHPGTFHEQLVPHVAMTEDAHRLGVGFHNRSAPYLKEASTSFEADIHSAEVMTITAVDVERGVVQVQRGRQGTVPIRFDNSAHVWALPGQLSITSSTFSGNVITEHEYNEATSFDMVDVTQATVRSEVAEFAPRSIVENTTFFGNQSEGPLASIWSDRTSVFTGANPRRYDTHNLVVYDDETTPVVGDKFAGDISSMLVENTILSGGHDNRLNVGNGELQLLPASQRYQNFNRGDSQSRSIDLHQSVPRT